VQQQLEMPRARRDHLLQAVAEGGQPHPIALPLREPGEGRDEHARVRELVDRTARIVHGPRHVEREEHAGVGVGLVLLDVEAVGARVRLPVDAAEVIARLVLPMLREVETEPLLRGPVQSVHEPVHDRAREERQVGDAREERGIKEGLRGSQLRMEAEG